MKVSPLDVVSRYTGSKHSTDGACSINSMSKGLNVAKQFISLFSADKLFHAADPATANARFGVHLGSASLPAGDADIKVDTSDDHKLKLAPLSLDDWFAQL